MIAAEPTILDRLEDVRENARGWMAVCPAHEDRSASLSIGLGDDGRILLNCFAGCSTTDVIAAAGVEWAALFPEGPRLSEQVFTPTAPKQVRRKSALNPVPVNVILDALNAAGIDWRATPDVDMWVIAECPRCLAPDVWLYAPWEPHWSDTPPEPPRFSCPDGCEREDILAVLEDMAYLREMAS